MGSTRPGQNAPIYFKNAVTYGYSAISPISPLYRFHLRKHLGSGSNANPRVEVNAYARMQDFPNSGGTLTEVAAFPDADDGCRVQRRKKRSAHDGTVRHPTGASRCGGRGNWKRPARERPERAPGPCGDRRGKRSLRAGLAPGARHAAGPAGLMVYARNRCQTLIGLRHG